MQKKHGSDSGRITAVEVSGLTQSDCWQISKVLLQAWCSEEHWRGKARPVHAVTCLGPGGSGSRGVIIPARGQGEPGRGGHPGAGGAGPGQAGVYLKRSGSGWLTRGGGDLTGFTHAHGGLFPICFRGEFQVRPEGTKLCWVPKLPEAVLNQQRRFTPTKHN